MTRFCGHTRGVEWNCWMREEGSPPPKFFMITFTNSTVVLTNMLIKHSVTITIIVIMMNE